MTKIEEVARAIMIESTCGCTNDKRERVLCCDISLDEGVFSPKIDCECWMMAKVVIEAMRTPSPEMVKAGVDYALSTSISGDSGGWPGYISRKHEIMIDAALNE